MLLVHVACTDVRKRIRTGCSPDRMAPTFHYIDQLVGMQLGFDLSRVPPGRTRVVASRRRLCRERSYGFVHGLWWVWLADGRSLVSVPPGARTAVEEIVADAPDAEALLVPALASRLEGPMDEVLRFHHLRSSFRVERSYWFACNAGLLRRHDGADCRRLSDGRVPAAEHISWPLHCFPGAEGPEDPGGIIYGVIADDQVVSVAYSHRCGLLEDRVADLGVETAPAYQRRGYAQTAVSAVVAEITARGGEARYGCSVDNVASAATARSVGFVPYATVLVLAAPAPIH
jgi:hypothetical protein